MVADQNRQANVKAAAVSVASNSFIIMLELTGAIITGSVSIVAGVMDSMINLTAAVIAFFSVRVAARPPDREHPFGHGKVENISATVEAILIFFAAGLIIYEAVRRVVAGAQIAYPELGIGVMLGSMLVNLAVTRYLLKVSQKTDSIAIEAEARHLTVDAITSLGILLGLLAVRLTGITLLDPLIAIGIALYIMRTGYIILRKAFAALVDVRLPAEEERAVRDSIMEHFGELIGFHELRTRKSGAYREIDLHLVMSRTASLEEVHRMTDHLEADIARKLPNARVTIHVEPCETDCMECDIICPLGEEKADGNRSGK